jgi:hypothetical protein
MSGLSTGCSDVLHRRTTGSPSSREGDGDGASIGVVGVTSYQGDQESWPQGKGRQGEQTRMATGWQATKCISPALFPTLWCVLLESPVQGKLARRVWEGAEEKGLYGTSSAAYFTWEEVDGNVPKSDEFGSRRAWKPLQKLHSGLIAEATRWLPTS